MNTQKQTYPTVVRATGDEAEILISTIGVDRDGDVLEPYGVIREPYARNPVVLFSHRHDELPVAATTSLDVEAGRGIRARFRWLERDPFAARVRNAFEQGVLRAASVGFIPREFSPRSGGRGLHITKWEIVEWSLVCIPSNPEAVRRLKGMGLWEEEPVVLELSDSPTDVVLELEDESEATLRRNLAAMYRAAAEAGLRAQGFYVGGDPVIDPAERQHVQQVIRSVVREAVGDIAREATVKALERLRGLVD